MKQIDSIEVGDGTTIRTGDIVHIMSESPWAHDGVLVSGRVNCILGRCDLCCEIIEVEVNDSIVEILPENVFSTRQALVQHYINVLLKRVKMIDGMIDHYRKEIENAENTTGKILIEIHDLKKEIGEA